MEETGLLIFFFIMMGMAVLMIASFWKIFQKAGYEGWEAIIPIYGTYILLKIVGKPGWWLLLFFIPLVNIVFGVWMYNLLSKSFGQDVGFTLGLIFFTFVFVPMLAFGDYRYLGPAGAEGALQMERADVLDELV